MKNPLVQTALPFALSYAMGSPWAMKLGQSKMFSGMSPLMANALKQSALGYGTAALSGSKRPWKGAMYAGLTSIPFSYMSAAKAADAYGAATGDVSGWKKVVDQPFQKRGFKGQPFSPHMEKPNFSRWADIPATHTFEELPGLPSGMPKKLSAWDIMTGGYEHPITKARTAIPEGGFKYRDIVEASKNDPNALLYNPKKIPEKNYTGYSKLEDKFLDPGGADIFTKPDIRDGLDYGTKTDWLPTAAAQAAALYGGRETAREEWIRKKNQRKKELAWLYGVDEDLIEGEMDNPWANPHGYWNKGGIASLDKSYGGDVNGPGTGTSDSIDAKLSDGEFVMTAKAVENFGGGDRYEGARKMYQMMNMLDPQSESMSEVV